MDRVGVILCAGEEKLFISLMMWLQSHHNVSCVKMISYRNVINILADEADTPSHELLHARLDDLITRTGASHIVVVDSRSGTHGQGLQIENRERISAARQRTQSWFPDLTVVGLSIDDRYRFLSDTPDTRLSAG
jgi:hypothetical protein